MTTSTFEIDDLIRIAKRENNTKRSYLYVNPIQGKHIPVSPSLSIKLFSALAEKIEKRYQGERLLVIGFAETATAIGSTIAYKAENVKFYMTQIAITSWTPRGKNLAHGWSRRIYP